MKKYKYKGKRFKCLTQARPSFIKGEYYLCVKENIDEEGAFIDEQGDTNGFGIGMNTRCFDLKNPLKERRMFS